MPNSTNNYDVGIGFLILWPLPFLFSFLAFAAATAASWESCDALSRVGLRTRLEQRGSGLELSVSGSELVELSVGLLSSIDMLSVLGSPKSWVSRPRSV
jgi:hypothetical protein